jgi:CheY-like chemotaxis protein
MRVIGMTTTTASATPDQGSDVAPTMHMVFGKRPMLSTSTYRRLADAAATPTVSTRMLIASDDPDTLELIELGVHGPGVEICVASDGIEVLELIAECDPFDLIVMDINMSWIGGLHVLASMREAGLETPALVVTALDRPGLTNTIARMRNAMLLRKPFEIADLQRAIATLLGID